MKKYKVAIIGSGNVGTHLALSFFQNKIGVSSVFSQNIDHAITLAQKIDSVGVDHVSQMDFNVDLVIIAVKDDAIEDIVTLIPKTCAVVHTSGSVDISALTKFQQYGILYPLQTFSKQKTVDFSEIPILLEANNARFYTFLAMLSELSLSKHLYDVNSEKRAKIHLAAVIANNFSTQLMVESAKILNEIDLDLSIIKPLIRETIDKIFTNGPKNALTGPAIRGDQSIIDKQIEMLDGDDMKEVYLLMTKLIQG